MIPEKLYRGDSDKEKKRELKLRLKNYQFQTNLLDKGVGATVFVKPLSQLVNGHIEGTWGNTHFLSFTSDREAALNYGKGRNSIGTSEIYYEEDDNWDFLLIQLNIKQLDIEEVQEGIYKCFYYPHHTGFPMGYNLLILDTAKCRKFLSSISKFNSERDKEWLLLPITPDSKLVNPILMREEHSALIPLGNNVFEYEKFKLMRYE